MKNTEILIMPGAYFLVAVGILLLPLNWFSAAIFAAAVHELSHIAMLRWLNVTVHRIIIGPLGSQIITGTLEPKAELLCAVAGPIGSFSLLLLMGQFPLLSLLGLAQGVFNLLPVYPLDGGRMIRTIFLLAKNRH